MSDLPQMKFENRQHYILMPTAPAFVPQFHTMLLSVMDISISMQHMKEAFVILVMLATVGRTLLSLTPIPTI